MKKDRLQTTLLELSDIQRRAVAWNDGALLVVAGPGSGKTRVLTCRVAQLLDQSRDERFRILALTFTNKAAHEMSTRVMDLVPGLEERADIHTFHGFCAQVLRQHGVHLGIKPDFAIYSQRSDREAVLDDAIRRGSLNVGCGVNRILHKIDALKARLISPDDVEQRSFESEQASSDEADCLAHVYRLYEEELRSSNALDFNSLIFETYRLFAYPALVKQYQTVYRHWLVDEFQDTNGASYALLRRMAGENFRKIFAVADDDQTIYEWNGANVHRIRSLVEDFDCEVVQLPTNFRCPAPIVDAANRLVVYNLRRFESKRPTSPALRSASIDNLTIECRLFQTDEDETAGITSEIAALDVPAQTQTLVLARTRALLESIHKKLVATDVPATILMRRDDFASPELRWLVACLKQIHRPLDRRNMTELAERFRAFARSPLDVDDFLTQATAKEVPYLWTWLEAVRQHTLPSPVADVVDLINLLVSGDLKLTPAMDQIIGHFENDEPDDDLKDDLSAWRRLSIEIRTAIGQAPLGRFLQELEMRSKEPIPPPNAISLATIHGAKGLEFDIVYLIGLAEEILPSWHSVNKGKGSAAIEEERRGCFVAITRTKKRLVLSRARKYKGWPKKPSRFLAEMGLTGDHSVAEPRGER